MVLTLEVPFAAIAMVLSIVSWKTFRAIKHLGIGQSFWIPMLASGILFFAGSIVAIVGDLGFSLTVYMPEIVSACRLLALCALVGGVYAYSRKITKEHLSLAEVSAKEPAKSPYDDLKATVSILEQFEEKPEEKKFDCRHELGHLRTLPRRTPIPEECLGCSQIIECKFSLVKKTKDEPAVAAPTTSPDMMISDYGSEEKNINIS